MENVRKDPNYYNKLAAAQNPGILWVGCADSRMPPTDLFKMGPGSIFVQRNVAALAPLRDTNCFSTLTFGVRNLQIGQIILCGHYGCGGVQAALGNQDLGMFLNLWLNPIREVRNRHKEALIKVPLAVRGDRLCELNVAANLVNLARSEPVQTAWRNGQKLSLHAMILILKSEKPEQSGKPEPMDICFSSNDDLERFTEINGLRESLSDLAMKNIYEQFMRNKARYAFERTRLDIDLSQIP